MAPFCKLNFFNFQWQMGSRLKPICALRTAGQPPTGNDKNKKLLQERQVLVLLAALFFNYSHTFSRWPCQSVIMDFLYVIVGTKVDFFLIVKMVFEMSLKPSFAWIPSEQYFCSKLMLGCCGVNSKDVVLHQWWKEPFVKHWFPQM